MSDEKRSYQGVVVVLPDGAASAVDHVELVDRPVGVPPHGDVAPPPTHWAVLHPRIRANLTLNWSQAN